MKYGVKIFCPLIAVMLFLALAGCSTENPPQETAPEEETVPAEDSGQREEGMELEIDDSYGGLWLRWNKAEDAGLSVVTMVKAEAEGEILTELRTYDAVCDLRRLVAFGAQESGFFGEVRFAVKDLEPGTEKVLQEGISDSVLAGEYFPEEEEIPLEGRGIEMFTYSRGGPSSYKEELRDVVTGCTVYRESDGDFVFAAEYCDSRGKEKEIEKKLSQEDWEDLLKILEGGKLVRKTVSDPNEVVLDGDFSGSQTIWFTDSTFLEQEWYTFVPEEGRQDLLMQWIVGQCKN